MTKKILNSLTDTIALSCGPDGPVTCEPRVEEQSAESERDKFCKRLNHKATAPFEFFDSTPAMGDQRFYRAPYEKQRRTTKRSQRDCIFQCEARSACRAKLCPVRDKVLTAGLADISKVLNLEHHGRLCSGPTPDKTRHPNFVPYGTKFSQTPNIWVVRNKSIASISRH